MKWSEMSDKDKIERVIVDVLGLPIFDWRHAPATGPHAYWNVHHSEWHVANKEDEVAKEFDPLHDMNNAWQIVECDKFDGVEVKRSLFEKLDEQLKYTCLVGIDGKLVCTFAETAQEAICIASLVAAGVEIEP